MEITKYVLKHPHQYQIIQWDGKPESALEIIAWTGGEYSIGPGHLKGVITITNRSGSIVYCNPNEYIVYDMKYPNFSVYSYESDIVQTFVPIN